MKAVILAAGKGNRLGALTNGAPKSMLPLGDSTLMGHSLDLLARCGVTEVILVTGYQRRVLTDYVRGRWPHRLQVVFNPHFETTNVLYSFWLALPYIGESDFIFLHADTVFAEDVLRRLLAADSGLDLLLAVDRHVCAEEEMKVRLDGDRIVQITKEMPAANADGEFLGVARIGAAVIPRLKEKAEELFEARTFLAFFELAIQSSIEHGELDPRACDVTGLPWREVDFEEDYRAALALFPR